MSVKTLFALGVLSCLAFSAPAQAEPPPTGDTRIGGFVMVDADAVREFVAEKWEKRITLSENYLNAGRGAFIHFKRMPHEFGMVVLGGQLCSRGATLELGKTYFVVSKTRGLAQPCITAIHDAAAVIRAGSKWSFEDYETGYLPKPVRATGPLGILSMQPGARDILQGKTALPTID